MTDIAHIHEVLDRIDAAATPGMALDAIPDSWSRFLSGPDETGFHFSLKPRNGPDVLTRIYDRGLAMGSGATQIEAIKAGLSWIRNRIPRGEDAPESPTAVASYMSMAAASSLESARRRMLLISQGKSVAEAYAYQIDDFQPNEDLPLGELMRSHLVLLLAAATSGGSFPVSISSLVNVADGDTFDETYGDDGILFFRADLRKLLPLLPNTTSTKWLAVVETDGAITRVLGIFGSRKGAKRACTSLLGRQARGLPEFSENHVHWQGQWHCVLEDEDVIAYTPTNGMADPRQKLRIMSYESA